MKRIGAVFGCGALLAVGSCSDTSPRLLCGSGTVATENVCHPDGSGGEAGEQPGSNPGGGSGGAASSAQGGEFAGGTSGEASASAGQDGTSDNVAGAGGDEPSSGGEAGTPENAGGAGAGGGASPCTKGPIECAPGVALANTGYVTTSGGGTDLFGLDDTSILVGNAVESRLDIFDLCSGTAKKSWSLPAKPGDIAFDAVTRTAYVVLRGQPAIAKVQLDRDGVTAIDLPRPALALAIGNHGRVFARLEDQNTLPRYGISIVDSDDTLLLNTVYDDFFRTLVAYDRKSDRLLIGSDLQVRAYSFIEATNTLSLAQYNSHVGGGNCQQLLLSPDQRHLVLMCGGGNDVTTSDPPYQIVDVDPADLQVLYGFYSLGYYPFSAVFSPGNEYFYTLGDGVAIVFSVATHARLRSYPMRTNQLSISPSGRVLMGREGGTFSWVTLRESSDCR